MGYAQDIPLRQSGARKNMNMDCDFVVIVRFGFHVTGYVASVVGSDFDITDGTRKQNEVKISTTSFIH